MTRTSIRSSLFRAVDGAVGADEARPRSQRRGEVAMMLAPRELDKLYIYIIADLARKRRARGLTLNYEEATAIICEAMLEGAREGKTVAELMSLGKTVLTRADVMDGVPDILHVVQVEATFPDGTKLISCHDPISA